MAPPNKGNKGNPNRGNARKGNAHKGKRRFYSSPEEIQEQLNRLDIEDDDKKESEDETESSDESDEESDSEESDTDKPVKGVAGLIEIENPNRNPKPIKSDEMVLSRREREEIARQQAKERHLRLTAEGKTDEAKADLARLQLIRQQREEANRKREMERKLKEQQGKKSTTTKTASAASGGPRLTSSQKETLIKSKKAEKN